MKPVGTLAEDTLRGDILAAGGDDFVSMADVHSFIDDGELAGSGGERQRLVLNTIHPLLKDGLVEVGGIPSPSHPAFDAWPGAVDEVMTRLNDRFLENYDNQHEYAYKIWLNLTDNGRRVSACSGGGRYA